MMRFFTTLAPLLMIVGSFFTTTAASAAVELTGSNSFTGTTSVAMPITDLQLTGSSGSPVPVKLLVTNGTLSLGTTTNITFTSGGNNASALYFSGTVADINAALASLTYTRGSAGSDTLEVSLVNPGEVFFPDNGHLYKFISGSINWNSAKTAAEALTEYGVSGYLVTVTSSAENAFVAARLGADGWMGASDAALEGDWKWVTGPETGTSFWSGTYTGGPVSSRYSNWNNNEPNQAGEEDCAQFYSSSGKWNDLSCGNSIGGYVAEFGAGSTNPTVVAKNISITTANNPTISSLTPADNSTNITTGTNLTMVFSTTISVGTGNILIKKTSDDSTVETIDVASGKVTGWGTNTIVINPDTTLAESTGYYISIPNTAFKDGSNRFYAGISNNSTWNFTTGDFTAPVLSAINSVPSSTSTTITWTTNENASTRVSYGATSSYGVNTSETDTSPRVTSHTVNLTSLIPCTTYNFRVTSTDGSVNANVANSTNNTFKTTGCTANSESTAQSSTNVTTSSTSTTSLTDSSTTLVVQTPSNFTTTPSLVIQIQSLPSKNIISNIGTPSGIPNHIGDIVFDVKAIVNATTVLDSFDAPVTITYTYTDEDIEGIEESTLWLYHYHNNAWAKLDNCTVDMANNFIQCTTQGFSLFSLFGQTQQVATSNALRAKGCRDSKAKNYSDFVLHVQEMCEYSAKTADAKGKKISTPVFTKDLQLGSKDTEVYELQKFLNNNGFVIAKNGAGSPGKESQQFGALTKNALRSFQKAHKISPATGNLGPITRKYITDLSQKK
ncbi:MAG TPA: Ig-like domain-containing protein [Candidatus Paceibacterota bacterium]